MEEGMEEGTARGDHHPPPRSAADEAEEGCDLDLFRRNEAEAAGADQQGWIWWQSTAVVKGFRLPGGGGVLAS